MNTAPQADVLSCAFVANEATFFGAALNFQSNDAGAISAVMEVFTDITEVKALERQLTLMGRAVAGMAHRVKNILMGLEGGIFVVNTGLESDDREAIDEGCRRLARALR